MEALARAAQANDYKAKISLVISNRPKAAGIDKAKALDLKTLVIDHKAYKTRLAFEQNLDKALRAHSIELVCSAGFMRVLTPWLVGRWQGRLLNIHPSLLPKFKGLNTHRRALDAGEKTHGCTVHYVSEDIDAGEILGQSSVKIWQDDTEQTLAARVLRVEHILYPHVLNDIAKKMTGEN